MEIWKYPLGSLLEGVPIQPGSDPLMTYDMFPVDQTRVVGIPTHSGFGSVAVANNPTDQLLVKQGDDGQWQCVGFYIEDTIMLDKSVRKAGLAEELALRVIEARPDKTRPAGGRRYRGIEPLGSQCNSCLLECRRILRPLPRVTWPMRLR